ncbi:MAG: outer membrane protein transport protein [bacterium]
MNKKILILMCFLAGRIYAYTNLGVLNFGDPYYTGGKGTALGLTAYSSAKDASAVFTNPAAMGALTGTRILLSLPLVSVSERVVPDSDWSGYEGGAYYNSKLYADIPDFAIAYSFGEKIKLGFGITQRQNFRYKHTQTFSSGETFLDFEGKNYIKGNNFAGAMNLGNDWSLGVGYEILSGKPTFKEDLSGGAFVITSDYDFSGDRTFYSLSKNRGNWNVSFSYFKSAKLDYDWKYTYAVAVSSYYSENKYKGSVDFPKTFALGFNYVWGGAVAASLYFDIVKTFWSNADATYKDRISFHMGIENDLSSRLQLRYGMALLPSYERSYVERAFLTAGFGYYLSSSLNLDFGYAYGRRDYLNDWEGGGISYSGRLNETLQIINVSLDWKI